MTNAENIKWLTIKQNNNYEISNNGMVRNKKTGKQLKLGITHCGYYIVTLSHKNKPHSYAVHKLVMEHFNRCAFENEVINHIDSNKLNNNIDNLEYVTQKENVRKAWESGLCENVRKSFKTMEHKNIKERKPIIQKDLNGNIIATYISIREAERKTGITSGQISQVCRGKNKTTHNFIFNYLESEAVL